MSIHGRRVAAMCITAIMKDPKAEETTKGARREDSLPTLTHTCSHNSSRAKQAIEHHLCNLTNPGIRNTH